MISTQSSVNGGDTTGLSRPTVRLGSCSRQRGARQSRRYDAPQWLPILSAHPPAAVAP
jgi:hypothetical protein